MGISTYWNLQKVANMYIQYAQSQKGGKTVHFLPATCLAFEPLSCDWWIPNLCVGISLLSVSWFCTSQKTHCGFWWPELMQMVPPAGSSPFGANGRGWTYLENFHHFTAKELELAHSLNSRGSSSLRTETSLVMMCESYPSCCIIACNLS